MSKLRFWPLAVSLLMIGPGAFAKPVRPEKKMPTVEPSAGAIHWRTEYAVARRVAEERKLPLVIVLLKPPSPPCERLKQNMEGYDPLVRYLNEQTIPLLIASPNDDELYLRFGIHLYPTLVLADSDGRIRGTLIGYQEPDELLQRLRKIFSNPN